MSPPPAPRSSRNGDDRLPIRAGAVVADKYVVEGVIGAGGVGVVVSARHLKLDERVAIKFLQTSAMSSEENVSRFDREARLAARIKSEHVARVMDFGALPSGAPFMVLEHLDGLDLGAVLRAEKRVPVRAAVDYVAQACEAVVEAHALGIIHRDLKPANLFLTKRPDGTPIIKVLDFGISKLLARSGGPADMSMTSTASVIGSPLYMSPEQMESPRDTNELTDVWSLGTILYELIAGAPPFEAATMPALCAKICAGSPTPLSARLGPSDAVPAALENAIMKCLERDRGARHASVAELVRKIAPFGSLEATRCSELAMRVAQQAGLPLSFDDDDELTQVSSPIAPDSGSTEHGPLEQGPPSEARPVSFMPKPNRLRTPPRVLAALAGVLFVGTLIGAAVTRLRAPAPAQIIGRAARTVSREAKLVTGSYFTHPESPSVSAVAAPSAAPEAEASVAAPTASADASSRTKTQVSATKHPPATSAGSATKHGDTHSVLTER